MTKYDKERQEEYERQRKEDEQMMRDAEQGANAAQAAKNASEIGALASIAGNAAQKTAQQMTGGIGDKPQYETEQEKAQNQAAVEKAVAGVTSDTSMPGGEEKKPEYREEPFGEDGDKVVRIYPDGRRGLYSKDGRIQYAVDMALEPGSYAANSKLVYGEDGNPYLLGPDGKMTPILETGPAIHQDNPKSELEEVEELLAMTPEERQRIAGGMQQQAPGVKAPAEGVNGAGGEGVGSGEAVVDSDLLKAAKDANKQREKQFSDIINDYYNQRKADEEDMRRQEQANMYSSMATGTTELAAGIINMLAVGELGATHQQYNNPTADWMKKADADMKANRERRRSMADTMQRLKMQAAELKAANRIEEAKLKHQLEREREADRRYEQERAERLAQQEWQRGVTEKNMEMSKKAQERADKQTDAAIAQRWSQINDSRKAQVATFLEAGYVPDKNSPSGYRYDPEAAKKWAGNTLTTKQSSSTKSGKDKPIRIQLLASGNLPAETIEAENEEVLKNTILSNIDAVTDLMDSQKMEIIQLMENENIDADKKANLLKRYLVSSGQLRSLFRPEGSKRQPTFTGGVMSPDAFIDALNN